MAREEVGSGLGEQIHLQDTPMPCEMQRCFGELPADACAVMWFLDCYRPQECAIRIQFEPSAPQEIAVGSVGYQKRVEVWADAVAR